MGSESNRRIVEIGGITGVFMPFLIGSVIGAAMVTIPAIATSIRDAACLQVCDGVGTYVPAEKRCSCRVAP